MRRRNTEDAVCLPSFNLNESCVPTGSMLEPVYSTYRLLFPVQYTRTIHMHLASCLRVVNIIVCRAHFSQLRTTQCADRSAQLNLSTAGRRD